MFLPQLPKNLIEERLDKKFAKAVKLIAGQECEKCGKGIKVKNNRASDVLEAHHIFTRNNRSTRWDVRNGVCLCKKHHQAWQYKACEEEKFSAHGTPAEFMEWIEQLRGNDFMADLRLRTHKLKKFLREDYEEVDKELNEIIKKYEKPL